MADIVAIVDRKRAGTDCTEEESAEILSYFDRFPPEDSGSWVAHAFPLEAEQWYAERERGDR